MNPKEMWQALTGIIERIDSIETLDTGCVADNSWRTNAPITGFPMGLMISRSYKNYVMPTSHRLIQKCRKYRGCSPSTIADNTTLDTRDNDEQDFYELPVWLIKEIMEAAYTAGFNNANKEQ